MDLEDLKGLKYYVIYCVVLIVIFIYSGMTGWKWFNTTETGPTRSTTPRAGYLYRYHK